MNGTIQIDNHTGEAATTVRLGNNSTAFVDNSVRWRIQPAAPDELFLDYRDFDNVRDNLVTRELRAALNEVFANFDPLAPENSDGANVQALGDDVAEKLRTKVGGQIEIINVIVPLVNYDQATQDRINALNVEKANTRVGEQRAKTAAAEAKANEILAASVSNDPNVLVSKAWTPRARRTSARWAAGRTRRWCPLCQPGNIRRFSLCLGRFMGHDSHVLCVTRSVRGAVLALLAAVTIGLASSISAPAPASAVSPMPDVPTPPPSPLVVFITPFTFGMHVIEAISEGIANAVEAIATPAPIAIPAPDTSNAE
jgi:hypothetical protein